MRGLLTARTKRLWELYEQKNPSSVCSVRLRPSVVEASCSVVVAKWPPWAHSGPLQTLLKLYHTLRQKWQQRWDNVVGSLGGNGKRKEREIYTPTTEEQRQQVVFSTTNLCYYIYLLGGGLPWVTGLLSIRYWQNLDQGCSYYSFTSDFWTLSVWDRELASLEWKFHFISPKREWLF